MLKWMKLGCKDAESRITALEKEVVEMHNKMDVLEKALVAIASEAYSEESKITLTPKPKKVGRPKKK